MSSGAMTALIERKAYETKEDYHRDIDEIKDICKQIFNKLDNKADKS